MIIQIFAITYRAVQYFALKHLRVGIVSPYNTAIDYQRFASSLVFADNSAPTTQVSDDEMAVSYQGKTLHIPQWRIGLQELCDGLETDLANLCGSDEDLPIQIPLDAIDNWTDSTRGYSWLNNGPYLTQERPLMNKLLHDDDLKLAAIGRDDQLIIHKGVALSILRQTASINRKLALLSFLSPGQTPRMAEFVDHKHVNSTRPRTMFRAHGELWLVTRRVKYENLIRRDVFIPIKAHPRLQKLLEQYFLVVRPLEEDLAEIVYGAEIAKLYSEYMWVEMGQKTSSDHFSDYLQTFLQPFCSAPIKGKNDRQIAVEIARIFLGSQHEILQDEDEDDILAAQRGHNLSTSRRSYALEVGHLPSMSSDALRRYGRISEAWWEVIGFKTGSPPLLPLSKRRKHSRMTAIASTGNDSGSCNIDSDGLLDHITATVASEVQKAQVIMLKEIQKVVAAGIVAAMGQMNTLRPSTSGAQAPVDPVPLPPLGHGFSGDTTSFEHPGSSLHQQLFSDDLPVPPRQIPAAVKGLIPDPPLPASLFSRQPPALFRPLFNTSGMKRSRAEDVYDEHNTGANDYLYSEVVLPVKKVQRVSGLSGIPSHISKGTGHQWSVSLPGKKVDIFEADRPVNWSGLLPKAVPIQVQLERQEMIRMNEMKQTTAELIEKMAASLLTHCVPCWAWKRVLTQKHRDHKTYRDCKDAGEFVEWGMGWVDFKKKMKLAPFKYCYRCGLPQDEYMPTAHPKNQTGWSTGCPLDDTIAHILWVIRHVPEKWRRAVNNFGTRGLRYEMDTTEFAHWAAIEGDAERFYNGLELAVWYWMICEGFN